MLFGESLQHRNIIMEEEPSLGKTEADYQGICDENQKLRIVDPHFGQ
jgi:hypothetical protein